VFGAVATGVVGVIMIATKFSEGAWAVVVAIPLLVLTFLAIKKHYRVVGTTLSWTPPCVHVSRRATCQSLAAIPLHAW
jgi:hypothetical protein